MAAPTTCDLVTVAQVPAKKPDPNTTFKIVKDQKLQAVGDDDILIQIQFASVDPYLRFELQKYMDGKPMMNFAIAKVISLGAKVDTNKFKKGDLVQGFFPWASYAVLPSVQVHPIPPKVPKYKESDGKEEDSKNVELIDISSIPKSAFIGQFGMRGMSAYYGLFEKAEIKSSDTVLVSGAAGGVGSMVGQFAKVLGCKKIVGTAGSQEKLDYLKSIGFTHVINYKDYPDEDSMQKQLKEAFGDDGIDVYFDNTGGHVTAAQWDLLNLKARVAVCGQISMYNSGGEIEKVKPFLAGLIYKEISIKGFAYHYFKNHSEFYSRVGEWIINKQIILEETVVKGGLEAIPQAFCDLFEGKSGGKLIKGKLVVDLTDAMK